jgi:S1-C subfamily serine protease
VLRGDKKITLKIPFVEKDQDLDNILSSINPEKALVSRLGILGVEINSKMAAMVTDLRIKSGVVVAAKSTGPAVDTGIETGDVIHKVNTTDIASLEGLRATVTALKSGDPVVVQVERDGTLRYLSFDWE